MGAEEGGCEGRLVVWLSKTDCDCRAKQETSTLCFPFLFSCPVLVLCWAGLGWAVLCCVPKCNADQGLAGRVEGDGWRRLNGSVRWV